MVPRYARPEMTALWEPEAKYRIWFEIEAHATEKLGELGVVPESAAKALWDWWATDPKIDVEAIDAIEAVTKHDVIAFLTWVAENVGDEARFMHQGMTSSDVLDTTLAVQLMRSADILLADLDALLAAIKRRAEEHKYTPTIGRSHGIHAEPVTFGLKLAQAYAEFDRCRTRLVAARAEIATCAISGAVGTFANIDPAVEKHVAEKLGLAAEPVAAFYLQLWQSGPCMLLIETPEPGLESAMPGFVLLQDILRAVQLPDRPTLVGDFRWPLNRNPQLDRSAAAANRGLLAFLQARLESQQIVSVGCFGVMNTLLVETDLTQADALLGCEESVDGLPPVWFAPSLDSLLKRPQEKAALWTLLRRVRSRWQEKS